jgi:hypothetical protein
MTVVCLSAFMPAALLAQKWEYSAAVLEPTESNILHAQGLLTLVSGIASAESFLLAKGGNDAGAMLEWLVDGLGGGGGLGLEGATIAASSWPCLAAVPRSKRRDVLQAPFFAAAAQVTTDAVFISIHGCIRDSVSVGFVFSCQ